MLETPLSLASGIVLSNRIVKAAMTEAMCPTGNPSSALIGVYQAWASHGPAMLISGNVMVDRRYLERIGNLVFDSRTDEARVQQLTEAVTSHRVPFFAQLSHPGRQTNLFIHPHPVAPSAVPAVKVLKAFGKPRALTEVEIEEIIERFVGAAVLAQRAGFSGVQIHAAHGYLISQFLSPLSNLRDDAWGGDSGRRSRFLMEVISRVRAQVGPRFGVAVKLNSADFQKGGFDDEESLRVVEQLDHAGIDFLEISGGNYESLALLGYDENGTPRMSAREAYFLEFAKKARTKCRIPLMLTGGLRSRAAMEEALTAGVDLIGLARPFCVRPDVPSILLAAADSASPAFVIPKIGIKAIEGQGETDWCNAQMRLIASGRSPDLSLGVRFRTIATLVGNMWRAIARRVTRKNQGLAVATSQPTVLQAPVF